MLRARGRGGVCLKRSGGVLRAWGRGGVCLKRSGGALQACKRGGVCLKRSEAREVCRRPGDVASKEVWRCAADVQTRRCLPQEIWSSGVRRRRCLFVSRAPELWRCAARVGTCRRHRGMELWSSGGALQACRRGDVEVWSSNVLLLLEFLAFVPQGSLRETLALRRLSPPLPTHQLIWGTPTKLSGLLRRRAR